MARPNVTRERLRELLHYDPETGVFTWLKAASNSMKAGGIAGSNHPDGYMKIQIDRRVYMAHRLVFVYVTGEWPPHDVDHRNGDRMDNRLGNLRLATRAQNMQNRRVAGKDSVSGLLGAYRSTRGDDNYSSWITICGRRFYLGVFDCAQHAHDAHCEFKLLTFPDWQPQCPCHSHLVQGS